MPNSANIHYALALHYVRTLQTEKALSCLEKAHNLEPENWQFLYALVLLLEELGLEERKNKLLNEISD